MMKKIKAPKYTKIDAWKKRLKEGEKKWNSQFGLHLPFSKDFFLSSPFLIQPREKSKLKSFKGKEFNEKFKKRPGIKWIKQVLAPKYAPDLSTLAPLGYLDEQPGDRGYIFLYKGDILYYEWEAKPYQFSMWESAWNVIIRVKQTDKKASSWTHLPTLQVRMIDLLQFGSEDATQSEKKKQLFPTPYYKGTETVITPYADPLGSYIGFRWIDWRKTVVVIAKKEEAIVTIQKISLEALKKEQEKYGHSAKARIHTAFIVPPYPHLGSWLKGAIHPKDEKKVSPKE